VSLHGIGLPLMLPTSSVNVVFISTLALAFIFTIVAGDSLGLHHPRAHGQRHIIIIIIRALLILRKPLQQPLKVHTHAQSLTSTKFQRPTHMRWAHETFSKTPNLGVPAQSKVQFAQRDRALQKVPRELHNERV
jgi:hypothetical protein